MERFRMWEGWREEWIVKCIWGKDDRSFNDGWIFWGDSSCFSGPFPLLTVLSGFCCSGPLLALGGLGLPPPSVRSGWTQREERRSPSGVGGDGTLGGKMTFSCKRSDDAIAASANPKEENEDSKEDTRQNMTIIYLYDNRGDTGSPPHLFLTSSQYSWVGVVTYLSLMFHLAGTMMIHNVYHKTSLLVGATVLFCTFAVPLSFSPEPNTFWSTYMSPSPPDTSLRPDRATSCPPELGLSASWDLGTFQSVYLCWFRPIAQTHPFLFFFFGIFSYTYDTFDDCVLHGVLWRFGAGPRTRRLPLRELAVISCPFITSVIDFAPHLPLHLRR